MSRLIIELIIFINFYYQSFINVDSKFIIRFLIGDKNFSLLNFYMNSDK